MPKVIVVYESQEREVELKNGSNVVGRSSKCGIPVKDDGISRQHCDIVYADGKCVVYDKGSKNGTVVNGENIKQKELLPGDKIKIGSTKIYFEIKKEASLGLEESAIGAKDDFESWAKPRKAPPLVVIIILVIVILPIMFFLKNNLSNKTYVAQDVSQESQVVKSENKAQQSNGGIQTVDSKKKAFDAMIRKADTYLQEGSLSAAYNTLKSSKEYANDDEQIASIDSKIASIKKIAQNEWSDVTPKIILAKMTKNTVVCGEAKSLIKDYIDHWGATDLVDEGVRNSFKEIVEIQDEISNKQESSRAELLLKIAKDFYASGKPTLTTSICSIIVQQYAGTDAAEEAKTLFEEIQGTK